MANDIKVGIGFVIPAAGVVGFFVSLFLGEFLISIIISIIGILAWFLYMLIMETNMPKQTGNMTILFGVMLSIGILAAFGVKRNMFGGYDFESNGLIFSAVALFFSILTGLNLRATSSSNIQIKENNILSKSDKDLVMEAINRGDDKSSKSNDPKVIVVKQETKNDIEKQEDQSKGQQDVTPVDPYGMANNPYFAYPPDYYDNQEDDEYEDDEYEDDEYEDDEYEDDEYEDDEYER